MKSIYIVNEPKQYSTNNRLIIACESKEDAMRVIKALGYEDEEAESRCIELPFVAAEKSAKLRSVVDGDEGW